MRTTVTLDEDVAAQLRRLTRERDLVTSCLDQPPVVVPGERHHVAMRELLQPVGTAGNLVSDAHLAALAVEHGAVVASSDRDFARFPGVRWVDPLAADAR